MLEALETKTAMSGEVARRYLQRAAMAGVVIGLLYVVNFAIIAAFDAVQLGEATLHPLGKIAGAVAFGWALVFIHYSKSELLTSNMMVVSVFIFAFLGFEYSAANTVLFTIIGLKEGIDVGLAAGNLVVALAGNFISGGLLIGLYYATSRTTPSTCAGARRLRARQDR